MSDRQAAPARSFAVHAAHEDRHHGHVVAGGSFEEAAIAFVEVWHPAVDADGEVAVIVRDDETGHEQCFRIDTDTGEAGPCN